MVSTGDAILLKWLEKLEPKCRNLSRAIYNEKHGHQPEEFIEGYNMGRGSYDSELLFYQTEKELKKRFPKPKVKKPPSNQPIVIKLDIRKVIEALPEEVKEKLKRKTK